MGMIATIRRREYKYRGLLAEACEACGIVQQGCTITISRQKAHEVIRFMVAAFEKGRKLSDNNIVRGWDVNRLAADVELLQALFDWLANSKQSKIVFI